jgi:hypothetical protein
MNSRLLKSMIKSNTRDQRIPAIAGTIFAVFLLIAILGAVFGDGKYPEAVLGGWVLVWTLIGVYILFAFKVASQWEKVIVLRLGKFRACADPACSGSFPLWIRCRPGSITA